jgi:hypothetical protein
MDVFTNGCVAENQMGAGEKRSRVVSGDGQADA